MPFDPVLYCLGQVLAASGLAFGSSLFLIVLSALRAWNRVMEFALAVAIGSAAVSIIMSAIYAAFFLGRLAPLVS